MKEFPHVYNSNLEWYNNVVQLKRTLLDDTMV